jgi:hypothetical protein
MNVTMSRHLNGFAVFMTQRYQIANASIRDAASLVEITAKQFDDFR